MELATMESVTQSAWASTNLLTMPPEPGQTHQQHIKAVMWYMAHIQHSDFAEHLLKNTGYMSLAWHSQSGYHVSMFTKSLVEPWMNTVNLMRNVMQQRVDADFANMARLGTSFANGARQQAIFDEQEARPSNSRRSSKRRAPPDCYAAFLKDSEVWKHIGTLESDPNLRFQELASISLVARDCIDRQRQMSCKAILLALISSWAPQCQTEQHFNMMNKLIEKTTFKLYNDFPAVDISINAYQEEVVLKTAMFESYQAAPSESAPPNVVLVPPANAENDWRSGYGMHGSLQFRSLPAYVWDSAIEPYGYQKVAVQVANDLGAKLCQVPGQGGCTVIAALAIYLWQQRELVSFDDVQLFVADRGKVIAAMEKVNTAQLEMFTSIPNWLAICTHFQTNTDHRWSFLPGPMWVSQDQMATKLRVPLVTGIMPLIEHASELVPIPDGTMYTLDFMRVDMTQEGSAVPWALLHTSIQDERAGSDRTNDAGGHTNLLFSQPSGQRPLE